MTNILKGDVDIVAFVIDATATETHAAAGVELRALLRDLRVPLVVAVNRCDDLGSRSTLRPFAGCARWRVRRALPIDRP